VPNDVKSLTREVLEAQFKVWGQPGYRLGQVLSWLYERRVSSWEEMTNVPKDLRERMRQQFTLRSLDLVRLEGAPDATRKFLWRLFDGALIESVLIPANPALYGEPSDRHTLCVSTQVGCAYGCKFCASGLEGWKRNLAPEEIVEQVLAVERWHSRSEFRNRRIPPPPPELESRAASESSASDAIPAALQPPSGPRLERLINNLVIMGMGEPLANFDALLTALTILNAPWGGGIGARKITISTSGLVPQIRKLADHPLQFRLAVSLHGGTDAVRDRIMPINRKYPLAALAEACDYYQSKKGRMITFEYILIEGVNDRLDQIPPLARLARRLHAKVNLIPYNQVEGLAWRRPSVPVQEAFLAALEQERIPATLRREKGHDIDAACGQLRLKTEREALVSAVG
jgi:23S rRNA (adenine2503-C2)-methyltransferase